MASGDESARCSGGVAIDPSKLVVTTSRFDVSQIQQIAGSVNKEFLVLERIMLSRDAKFSALPSPSPASFSPAPPRFDLLRFMRFPLRHAVNRLLLLALPSRHFL